MAAPTIATIFTQPSIPKVLHIRADSSTSKYHHLFSVPDADVVLRSAQGTLYRVHSYILRSTSGLFDTMFSLPQPKSKHSDGLPITNRYPDILDVYEDDFPMERVLCLMSGLPIPKWDTISELERTLYLAEKWDTPGPISNLRPSIASHRFLQQNPLRCYVLATHFGWAQEAKLASTHTLSLNLYDPMHESDIDQLSSKYLLPLLKLHRRRRDMFRELLNSPERFAAGNSSPYHCNRCGVTELNNHTWREFKNAMFVEIDKRPLGDTLGLAIGDAAEWPATQACWEAKCTKEGCGGLNYDRVATLRQIRACVALLPSTIDDDFHSS